MSKHTAYDLKQMQMLPLEVKVEMTKQRIEDWYNYWDGQVYVAFSGGKDSTALKHIVDSMFDDVPAVYIDTGLEYPEIRQFVKSIKDGQHKCFNSDVEILRPEMRFDKVIQEYGYPVISKEVANNVDGARRYLQRFDRQTDRQTFRMPICLDEWSELANTIREDRGHVVGSPNRLALLLGMLTKDGSVTTPNEAEGNRSEFAMTKYSPLLLSPFKVSDKCCNVMKKKPAHDYEKRTGRKKITGQMAHESRLRRQKWIQNGCNAFESSNPISNPFSFWTETDVLWYIKMNDIPYCSVYGDIVSAWRTEKRTNGEVEVLETTGCKRTGCMFCMFGSHIKGDKRFVDMKQTHPKQYEYCMKSTAEGGLSLKAVIDWLNENVGTEIKY